MNKNKYIDKFEDIHQLHFHIFPHKRKKIMRTQPGQNSNELKMTFETTGCG